MLNPEYNILKVAGSPLGYRHSEASKKLISIAAKNREVSELTRDLKREVFIGKTWDKERIEKMRLSNTLRKSVLVTNTETGDRKEFPSMTEAGKYLGISRVSVGKYLLKGTHYKGNVISNLSLTSNVTNEGDYSSNQASVYQQPVLLSNDETGDRKEFSSIKEAAEYLGKSRASLWYFFNKTTNWVNKTLKGYKISKLDNTKNEINPSMLKRKNIEVTNLNTNEVKVYPSFISAAKALGVAQSSLSGYFINKRTKPFKNIYVLKLV